MTTLAVSLLVAAAVGLGAYGLLAGRALRARSVAAAVTRVAVGGETEPARAVAARAHPLLPRVLLAMIGFAAGLAFLPPVAAALLGAAGFFVQPLLSSSHAARRRQQVADALPLALSRLASEVASGAPLPDALQGAAESLEADPKGKPLAEILRRTAAEAQAQGAEKALESLQERADVPPLVYTAAILRIHAGMGGHFERPLQRMADNYQALAAQVNAAKAELSGARSTAFVLMLFAVIAAFLNLTDQQGAGTFYRTPLGGVVLVAIVLWMAAGYFVIDRMLSEVL
ncbi:MAG TPA: hypothetical protein G4O00_14890 [Thermoflexia bacterium]|nr:hypothetical protein [Thermoflexia bacterium]